MAAFSHQSEDSWYSEPRKRDSVAII